MVIPKGRGTQPRSFFLRECVYVSMANNSNYSILSGSAGKGETSLSIDIPYPVENNNFIVWLILPTGKVVQGSGSYNNGSISITNKIDTSDEWGAIVYRAETAVLNATLKSSGEVSLSDIIAQFSKNVRVLEQLETLVKTSVRAVDEIGPLPNVAKRAGKFISFDDNGNPVANIATETFEKNRIDAETAEKNAKESEKNAKTSESNAKTSETNAKTSERNAKGYEVSASKSASASSESEKNALAYATMASNSSNTASNSAEVAKECKSEAEKYAQVAKSSANLTGAYANTTTEMLTGKQAISNLRFKTESGKQIVVNAEIVNGVPMLVPTIVKDVLDDAFSVLQWKTARGQKFVVFAEIVNGVPMLSCKI